MGRIVVDSFDEIDRLARLAGRRGPGGPAPSVLVRVTPGIEAHTHEYVMTGQDDSKFGFGLASGAAAEAVRAAQAPDELRPAGRHSRPHRLADLRPGELPAGLGAARALFSGSDLEELCIGGGLGVPYVTGETGAVHNRLGGGLAEKRHGLPASPTPSCSPAEPGRSIVAAAAITCYTVGTIKTLPGVRTYVSVDGGMSDNPRPVLYGSGYEAFLPGSRRRRPAVP